MVSLIINPQFLLLHVLTSDLIVQMNIVDNRIVKLSFPLLSCTIWSLIYNPIVEDEVNIINYMVQLNYRTTQLPRPLHKNYYTIIILVVLQIYITWKASIILLLENIAVISVMGQPCRLIPRLLSRVEYSYRLLLSCRYPRSLARTETVRKAIIKSKSNKSDRCRREVNKQIACRDNCLNIISLRSDKKRGHKKKKNAGKCW